MIYDTDIFSFMRKKKDVFNIQKTNSDRIEFQIRSFRSLHNIDPII